MKVKIRKGDRVEVISGAEKGEQGEVIKVMPKTSRIVVQGVNLQKKHQRQVQTQGRTVNPGIIEYEGPIHLSNVMLVCPKCDEPTRIGIRREDGERIRTCKKCDADLD